MITHQQLVSRLKKDPSTININSLQADIIHMTMGICGEAGELLDAVKKWVIYEQPLDCGNVIEEMGDLEFFMEGLRQALNIERSVIIDKNIEKLHKRYGGKYSNEAAKERKDKEVYAPDSD